MLLKTYTSVLDLHNPADNNSSLKKIEHIFCPSCIRKNTYYVRARNIFMLL